MTNKIKIDQLDDIEDENLYFYERNDILVKSILEWGAIEIVTLQDFIFSITKFLGGSLSLHKKEINQILSKKSIHKDAWKIESISTLLGIIEQNEKLDHSLDKLKQDLEKYFYNDDSTFLQRPRSSKSD
jgi:hypothetical protein